MQYVGKLVSSVYNTITPNINPSTLNGAIDVIVVEREVEVEERVKQADGTEKVERHTTTELAASPFHVRFGKLSVLRPDERKVTLHLNGAAEPLPFAMKVGENGEAFFVMKIDDAGEGVPAALVTSPIVGPSSEPEPPKSPELEPLDLGLSQTWDTSHENGTQQASKTSADASIPSTDQPPSSTASDPDQQQDTTEAFPTPFGYTMQDENTVGPENLKTGDLEPLHASKQVVMDLLDMDGYKVTQNKQQLALAQGKKFANEMPLGKRHGGNGSMGYGERLDHHRPAWKQQLITQVDHPLTDATELMHTEGWRPGHSRRASDTSLHISAEGERTASSDERPPIPVSISDSALLQNAKFMLDTSNVALPDVSSGQTSNEDHHSTTTVPNEDDQLMGKLTSDPNDPYQYQLMMESKPVYTFELSLCQNTSFDTADTSERNDLFNEARIPFQRFLEDDSIMDDPRLCIRHDASYHTASSNQEMFTALADYRAVLVGNESGKSMPSSAQKASVWSRLWGYKNSRSSSGPKTLESSLEKPNSLDTPSELTNAKAPEMEELQRAMTNVGLATTDELDSVRTSDTYVKTLRLTSDQLKQLNLRKGANTITFSVTSSFSGVATCRARVFLWDRTHPVVVSDIDGTITKSDALGHVFTMMGRDWTHMGVAKLYHDIAENGYRIMYLTSRAIGQAEITREYLMNINQNNYRLPDGPVIMSPDRLMASLHREVILKKPEVFKMACLRDIARLFGDNPTKQNEPSTPFYAGFGNRITDALSYRSVDIPSSRIFTIDSEGEVKMELLELAGYKSSYPNMTDLVDQMFPPMRVRHSRNAKAAAYTDFNFWRQSMADVELPPDDELIPVAVQPSSPTMLALRSPRQSSRQGSISLRSPTTNSSDQDRPKRFSRFGLSSLGLSRRKDRNDPRSQHANTSPPPASSNYTQASPDNDQSNISGKMLSTSPGARSGSSKEGVLFSEPQSINEEDQSLKHTDDSNDQQNAYAESSGSDQDNASDDDDGRLSPAARRRRRHRGQRAISPSLSLLPSIYDRDQRENSTTDTVKTKNEPPLTPDCEEDPLLAAGDIQFEWRG
ncbi:phosphatidate phosphatase [Malassezia yamatoensis]|uniref:phosphatidate phosphatase n=1 Tax=Malassezia yamatoensis TaxID=253288 RepID=A0AAJ6CFP8_9BASI|nr:phosphatidate phosphatase [Malassezia yamatoensis]